jgi:hypothetical protein
MGYSIKRDFPLQVALYCSQEAIEYSLYLLRWPVYPWLPRGRQAARLTEALRPGEGQRAGSPPW